MVIPRVEHRGWRIEVPDIARLTGVVGDPVRHCRIEIGQRS